MTKKANPLWASGWLALCSLVFYGWWSYTCLFILLASICFNYFLAYRIYQLKDAKLYRRILIIIGITLNLLLLFYFKYMNFFVNQIFSGSSVVNNIILPLGISFFTFTQITYLLDIYRDKAEPDNFVNYVLFVTFFPHLIAGPILYHNEMIVQFKSNLFNKLMFPNMATGITLFVFGLFKKVVIADSLAPYVNNVFDAVASANAITFLTSWLGAFGYTLQLYFDFSGYSDMACGLALLFNIKLPANFYSPYKARSIIEFWKRWHISLSRYLKDYLYIPLGGSKKGNKYINLFLTMVIGGAWHGAGWTFMLWGALHGFYLIVNHMWRKYLGSYIKLNSTISLIITFCAVVVGWVPFRSKDIYTAREFLLTMFGFKGLILQINEYNLLFALIILCLLLFVFISPNTLEITGYYEPMLKIYDLSIYDNINRFKWNPNLSWSVIIAVLWTASILGLIRVSEFLYYQF